MYNLSYICLTLLCIVAHVSPEVITKEMTTAELHKLEAKILEECRVSFSIEKSELEIFFNPNETMPSSKRFQCMLDCFATGMGFVKNKKVDWEMVKLEQSIYHFDKNEQEKALRNVENCRKSVQDVDISCETSYQLGKCLQEESRKAKSEDLPQ
uniref:Odorant-binding protein 2 n=1 Tax=Triatoma infestans TaxID=30076 RepID=A0A170ZAB4_TRIIF